MNRRTFIQYTAATAVAAGGVLVHAPAVHAQPHYAWKMATAWPKNFPGLGTGATYLAQAITAMSNNRLTVQVYAAGELVPAFEAFDAVATGKADMGHATAFYWLAKHPATQFFTGVPFGLNAQEMIAWLTFGGGQAPGSFSFRRGGCTTGPKQVKGFCSTWGPACLARPA